MRKLFRIEWLIAKRWLLFCAGFYALFLIGTTVAITGGNFDEPMSLFSLLPLMVTNLVICRTLITFDADAIPRAYKLLPVTPQRIVGSKFIFSNLIFLIFFCISLLYQLIVGHGFPDMVHFSWDVQCLNFSLSIFLINCILFGYYLLGAKNIQVVIFLAFVCILFGMVYLSVVPAALL